MFQVTLTSSRDSIGVVSDKSFDSLDDAKKAFDGVSVIDMLRAINSSIRTKATVCNKLTDGDDIILTNTMVFTPSAVFGDGDTLHFVDFDPYLKIK